MNNEEKKVALITGSTHGIGKAIALKLAQNHFALAINGATTKILPDSYIDSLKDIYNDELENHVIYVQADISNKDQRNQLINKIKDKFNRIDVLINNAGVAPLERNDILAATEESYERVMKINLQGPYFLTQSIANWMIKLKSLLKEHYFPYIINISSISSFAASLNRGEYCISKAGMSMMTKLYALRLSEYNIPVFEIQPGIILTRMTEPIKEKYEKLIENGLTPIKRWGLPQDIARAVSSIVNNALPYSTGEVIHLDGGFHLRKL